MDSGNWFFRTRGRTYLGFEPGKDGKPGGADEDSEVEPGLYDLRRDPGERYDITFNLDFITH